MPGGVSRSRAHSGRRTAPSEGRTRETRPRATDRPAADCRHQSSALSRFVSVFCDCFFVRPDSAVARAATVRGSWFLMRYRPGGGKLYASAAVGTFVRNRADAPLPPVRFANEARDYAKPPRAERRSSQSTNCIVCEAKDMSENKVIRIYSEPAGGWGALKATGEALKIQGIPVSGAKTLLHMNQPQGF